MALTLGRMFLLLFGLIHLHGVACFAMPGDVAVDTEVVQTVNSYPGLNDCEMNLYRK